MAFRPHSLVLLISTLSLFSHPSQAEGNDDKETLELKPSLVDAEAHKDQQAHDRVYHDNVTNQYLDREQLQRFQISNPGDVFKGMNGVYSMDARNGQSITPNIRGLSGEGRVPLTVDGTEQSTNVWLQVYGAGNRNYVDPSLFRSVSFEKGPSLSRDIKSGVGGAVSARTLDAADIIKPGESVGFELKLESSGNSIKPKVNANSYFGQDFRDIPGATLGSDFNVNIPQPAPRSRGHNDTFNFDDHSEIFAFAARNEVADILIAHSLREKGNYFAGKQGAGEYSRNDAYATDTRAYFPNLTKLYAPGDEVLSTSSDSKTTLIKNNWYLAGDHSIGLSFMRTDLEYAETSPGQAIMMLGIAEELAKKGEYPQLTAEYPRSELRLDTYKLNHKWTPEDSPLIDLSTSLWMTKTDGTRHQTGSGAYYIEKSPALLDYNRLKGDWTACRNGPDWVNGLPSGAPAFSCFTDPSLNPFMGATEPVEPDYDGRIYAGSAQWTQHDRKGVDISNLMQLSDTLTLTLGGSFQKEKLNETVANTELTGGIGVGGASLHYSTANYGPRSGSREEYTGQFNFEWQPLNWLTLNAGMRYNRYKSFDDGLAARRRQQLAGSGATKRRAAVELEYGELVSDQDMLTMANLNNQANSTAAALVQADYDQLIYNGVTTQAMAAYQTARDARDSFMGDGTFLDYINGVAAGTYWKRKVLVPIVDGKVDSSQSPLANNPINSTETAYQTKQPGDLGSSGEYALYSKGNTPYGGTVVYESINAANEWDDPERQSGDAWSPVLSATAQITPHGTLFARYAETTRFPSIFEISSTSTSLDGVGALSVEGASKPERSLNWEVGYAHDLRQFLPSLHLADVRISYFDTTIKDFIERDAYLSVIQFDEKRSTGIELQSRFDSGRYYGSLGATYRLKQELCDKDYAYGMDVYFNRVSECMEGGFADTLTATSLQPKYSINAELGTRLFNDRLELGWRGVYHAKAENQDLDDLLNSSYGQDVWKENSMRQLYWHSSLLHDLYARWYVQDNLNVNLNVTNLTDRYYFDPMSKVPLPGPGRTLTAGMQLRF